MEELAQLLAIQSELNRNLAGLVVLDNDDSEFLLKRWRKTAEVAEFLEVSSKTVLRNRDKMNHKKNGKTYLFETQSVKQFLDSENG